MDRGFSNIVEGIVEIRIVLEKMICQIVGAWPQEYRRVFERKERGEALEKWVNECTAWEDKIGMEK